MELNCKNLPERFRYEIQSMNDDRVVARVNLKSMDDINSWVAEFSRKTNTLWRIRNSNPDGERKFLVCQQSGYRRKHPDDNIRSILRSTNCPANLKVTIKINNSRTRYIDEYLKAGLQGVVTRNHKHNHTLNIADSTHLRNFPLIRKQFESYFDNGLGIAEALRYHGQKLEVECKDEVALASSLVNPKYRTVKHWHALWRKNLLGWPGGQKMHKVFPQMTDDAATDNSFFAPLHLQSEQGTNCCAVEDADSEESSQTDEVDGIERSSSASELTNENVPPSESLELIISLMKQNHAKYGTDRNSADRMYKQLQQVHNRQQWDNFLYSCGSSILVCRSPAASVDRCCPGVIHRSKFAPSRSPFIVVIKSQKET